MTKEKKVSKPTKFWSVAIIIALIASLYCVDKKPSYNNMTPEQAIVAYQNCLKDGNDADYCRTQTDVRVRVDNGGNRFFEYMGQYYMMRAIMGSNNSYSYPRYTYTSPPVWRYYEDSRPSPSTTDTSKDSKFGTTRDSSSNTGKSSKSSSSSSSFGSSRTSEPSTTKSTTSSSTSNKANSSSFSSSRSSSSSSSSSSSGSSRSSSSSFSSSSGRSSSSGSSFSSGRSSGSSFSSGGRR